MKTIWIDISDLYDWTGTLTGIQRVSYNVAKNYFDDKNVDAKFTFYSREIDDFCELDFNIIIEKVENPDIESNTKTLVEEGIVYDQTPFGLAKRLYHTVTPFKLRHAVNTNRHRVVTKKKSLQEKLIQRENKIEVK